MTTASMLLAIAAAVVGGVVSGSGVWLTFARTLVTRQEVDGMIEKAVNPLQRNQDRTDLLLESIRREITGLREDVVRLVVVLESFKK